MMDNHKNYNFLACDWFKIVLFSTNSLAKLLSDSLLLDKKITQTAVTNIVSSNSICNHTRDSQIGYHSYNYRPNWTQLSPITITYRRDGRVSNFSIQSLLLSMVLLTFIETDRPEFSLKHFSCEGGQSLTLLRGNLLACKQGLSLKSRLASSH